MHHNKEGEKNTHMRCAISAPILLVLLTCMHSILHAVYCICKFISRHSQCYRGASSSRDPEKVRHRKGSLQVLEVMRETGDEVRSIEREEQKQKKEIWSWQFSPRDKEFKSIKEVERRKFRGVWN